MALSLFQTESQEEGDALEQFKYIKMSWTRKLLQTWDFIVFKRRPIIGFLVTVYLMRRYSRNFGGMEKEVTRHGYYDPRKAEA